MRLYSLSLRNVSFSEWRYEKQAHLHLEMKRSCLVHITIGFSCATAVNYAGYNFNFNCLCAMDCSVAV